MPRFLPLVVLAAALAVALFFVLREGERPQRPGAEGPGRVALPVASETPAVELADVAVGTTPASRERATADVERDSVVAGAHGKASVDVLVIAPEGTPGDERVEVFAMTMDIGLGRLLGTVDLENDSDVHAEAGAFIDFLADEDRLDRLRAALQARADATRDADGNFRATLELERGRQVWLLAAGTHLRTPGPTAVTWKAEGGAEAQRLTPELGGALRIELSADGPYSVADQRIKLERAEGIPAAFDTKPNAERGLRVSQYRRSDAQGSVLVRALPAHAPLELTTRPNEATPVQQIIEALEPGETRTVTVALSTGASVAGVVSEPSGAPARGARVQVLLRGKALGFDDVVLREVDANEAGQFLVGGLPTGKLIVRAEHPRWLQSTNESIELAAKEARAGLTLTLREGRTLTGQLTFADGRPAGGVEVRARFDVGYMAGPQALNFASGRKGSANSSADGSFELRGLGGGPFVLEAEAPHASAPEGEPWRARADGVKPGVEGLVLTLHPALALSGRVVDEAGQPVVDVEVTLVRTTEGALGKFDQSKSTARSASADSATPGAFRADGLLGGAYELVVQSPSHVTLAPVAATLPADASREHVVTAHRAAKVTGVVQSPDGAPVAGARVFVQSSAPDWSKAFTKRPSLAEARTDEAGAFELVGVPPSDVALSATSEEWARGAAVPLTLAPAEERAGVTLVLSNGGTVTGEVFDDEGRPVGGRMIQVQRGDGTGQRQSFSAGDGTFRVEHLEPDRYQVIAIDLARMGDSGQSSSGDGVDVSGLMSALKMASVQVVDGEEVHVVLGEPPAHPVRVSGRVTQSGRSLSNVMVTFLPAGPKLYEHMKIGSTNADGEYELVLNAAGDYVVAVQRQIGGIGQQATTEFRAIVPDGDGSRHDFELPGGRISGRVVDGEGRPVPGARVSLSTSGGVRTDQLMGGNSAEIVSGPDGAFALEGLRAGTYRVAAGGAAFFGVGSNGLGRVVRNGLQLGENEALEGLELRLPEPGKLGVTVRGSDGATRSGVTVFARDADGVPLEAISFWQTNDAGHVMLEGLAPGRYTVSARGKQEAASDGPFVEVRAGQTAEATLTLEAGSVLRVALDVRGEGEVPSATVRVLDADGREVSGIVGLADLQELYLDGTYSRTEHRLGPIPPGRYTIEARSGELSGERRLTLRAGDGERTVTITLK